MMFPKPCLPYQEVRSIFPSFEIVLDSTIALVIWFYSTVSQDTHLGTRPPYCREAQATWRGHEYVFHLIAPAYSHH